MSFNRRNFLGGSLGIGSLLAGGGKLFAEEDKPNPKSDKFLLYIHFGSCCGAASGLLQPTAPGQWPKGFFQSGVEGGSNNPLLNSHTAAGNLVLHDYIKFLGGMSKDMCLLNGTPLSLDHNVAKVFQRRGAGIASIAPEWAMGVSQFMKSDARKNPMVLSTGSKTASVADITSVSARSISEFQTITSDIKTVPQSGVEPIWNVLRQRFAQVDPGSVALDPNLAQSSDYQLSTLAKGLPELNAAQAMTTALRTKLSAANVATLVAGCAEAQAIAAEADNATREELILAGILAKTGLASGMTIDILAEDLHVGGADVFTARRAAGKWALIALFWEWIKSVNLQNDVMIIVGQEFARSPYNAGSVDVPITDLSGKPFTVKSPGRDHGLSMGMMFINGNVPNSGRIGIVGSNMVPQATKDAKGTIDAATDPFSSVGMVGSMLMRCFDDLFPTERMVRKHWPNFVEIAPILS